MRGDTVEEGVLSSDCGRQFPIIGGIPRILPADLAAALPRTHPDFYRRHADLLPPPAASTRAASVRTQRAFGDEWRRFPEMYAAHRRIFEWYFEGPRQVVWAGLNVLDAGCGMGRWLHFVRAAGAQVVGLDASAAVDVAASREGEGADLVQADLRLPPFAPGSFDLVYCLGVLHHLENPLAGLRALARLVRPGGELRLYVYRTLEEAGWVQRALLGVVTLLRRTTVRLPFSALHALCWAVALTVTALLLAPRRLLRRWRFGERLVRRLPLGHYVDVPFRMLVAEQVDRFGAPIEKRYRRDQLEAWVRDIGFELVDILAGLGWRVICRRPGTTDRCA